MHYIVSIIMINKNVLYQNIFGATQKSIKLS